MTTVRRLLPADAQAYIALRREMLDDAPHAFLASPGSDFASDPDLAAERLAAGPGNVTFGAFADGLIGALGLIRDRHPKAAHKGHIWGVYVSPSARGRGAGRALLEAAIAHARTVEGITQLNLSVSARSPEAHRLYAALGFEAWGTEPGAMVIDGEALDEVHMRLVLGDG